jgi:glycosyltransferase involved in cell wall biosynthesis
LYGQNNGYKKPYKNIKYFGHISYSKVPKVLRKSQILLMPYSNNVHIRAKNVNTANYCSPLKMFDYLASGGIIISSKLNGICEVLKHKSNAVIVKNYDVKNWIREFKKITKREYDINKLSINSIKTARKNTWYLRVKKIIDLNR